MRNFQKIILLAAILAGTLAAFSGTADAKIRGLTGTTFDLSVKEDYISTGDGWSIYIWGYSDGADLAQYPGPTLIVNEGDAVTVNLTNQLSVNEPVSIVFPGMGDVAATGGQQGLLTREALPGDPTPVTYTFVASQPGTYMYHSGSRPDIQVEMGLTGAIIVRPSSDPMWAYNDPTTAFDREFLFLLTEMDLNIHEMVEFGEINLVDTSDYWPVYWFLNGRTAPDTMINANVPWLATQPYNCMPMMHPGERVLLRLVGGGRDPHPFHHHGNNSTAIARDGRLLKSGSGDHLYYSDFTHAINAGQTLDTLFSWTGEKLGWDIYGHGPGDPLVLGEYEPDHGKPLPVTLPEMQEVTVGASYSGSPFLGLQAGLPPGLGIDNLMGGYFFMWHSHTEREMVNNDIFPGGMMTMVVIVHPDDLLMEM